MVCSPYRGDNSRHRHCRHALRGVPERYHVTFVGGAAAYKKNLHFGIDVLLDLMPVSVRMFIRRIVNFVFIILFGYVTYLG